MCFLGLKSKESHVTKVIFDPIIVNALRSLVWRQWRSCAASRVGMKHHVQGEGQARKKCTLQRFDNKRSNSIRYLFSFADSVYDKLHFAKRGRLSNPDVFLLTRTGHVHVIPFVGKRVKIVSRERNVRRPQESKEPAL